MLNFLRKNHRAIFYTAWLVAGLLQSIFTELQDDEAYYWVFSRYLDWGYFDHPPMIALLIRLGTSLFGGELGVRLACGQQRQRQKGGQFHSGIIVAHLNEAQVTSGLARRR